MIMLNASITMGDHRKTIVTGKTIEEIIEKIKDFHTLGSLEQEYFTKKGTLEKERSSGWYLKEPS